MLNKPKRDHPSSREHEQNSRQISALNSVPEQYPLENAQLQANRRSNEHPDGSLDTRLKLPPRVVDDGSAPVISTYSSRGNPYKYDGQIRYHEQDRQRLGTSSGVTVNIPNDRSGDRCSPKEDQPTPWVEDSDAWSLQASLKKVRHNLEGRKNDYHAPDKYETSTKAFQPAQLEHISNLEEENKNKAKMISELQLSLKRRNEDIYNLQEKYENQAKKNAELQIRLKREVENSIKIKESVNRMAFAMERKEIFLGPQASDEVIYSHFQSLLGQIKTWSVAFARDLPVIPEDILSTKIHEILHEFQKVATTDFDIQSFLNAPKRMRLLVRGYVSLAIAESFFHTLPSGAHPGSDGEDVWMEKELARSFSFIEKKFFYAGRKAVSYRQLHDWRALTAVLISKFDGSSKTEKDMEACVTSCRDRIMSLFGIWIAAENRKVLEDNLLVILRGAVKFSRMLRCQRACWSVRYFGEVVRRSWDLERSSTPMFFDNATMKDRDGDENSDEEEDQRSFKKIVEIVISPGLFKRGDTDGERFEIESCIEKSEVQCKKSSVATSHVVT